MVMPLRDLNMLCQMKYFNICDNILDHHIKLSLECNSKLIDNSFASISNHNR